MSPSGPPDLTIRQGAYLPHWSRDGAVYAVTFRLADSLPQAVLDTWKFERDDIVKTADQMKRPLSASEEDRLDILFSRRVEDYLDAGAGECWLQRDEIASVVAGALQHFDSLRYRIFAWCVMPNHVHAVFLPLAGHELPRIVHSWKSYTATKANSLLRRKGKFWQPEAYDHLVRDEEDFRGQVEYVLANPLRAGRKDWKWVGRGVAWPSWP
jgi:REP element-mobilizing transposase RayT